MRRPSARITAAALCTALVFGLAACDAFAGAPQARAPFAGLSAPEITDKAVATTRAATTVRLAVTTESADGPVQAFVAAGARGACTGTFSLGAAGTMELVRADGRVYTKSDEAMLRAAAADRPAESGGNSGDGSDGERDGDGIGRLTGRWVTARADDRRTAESLRYCDPRGLLDRIAATSPTAREGGPSEVAGTPCLTLTGGTGEERWTANVATKGPSHLLRMRVTDGTGKALTVEFSGFGAPLTVKKPAAG
ncbi:hypothetical protein OG596_22335 [Streptomyces sp. NBC_01102]|uniref:hypothetical protein n=1 Tax=unclassified Streptomyces TaxID=2593676 RepID=UPI003862D928|nr:hypothetical protein OG596_22335 [Streptomyces sp. NBC_01102]